MAFNPFSWFRKHQKVFFAGLTVLCMIVFIGQAGVGADIFQTALGWFGQGRHGLAVVTLNGKKVTQPQLDRLARQRTVANDFLFDSAWRAHEKAIKSLLEKVKSTEAGNPLSGVREIVEAAQKRGGINMFSVRRDTRPEIRADLARLNGFANREQVKDDPERLQTLQKVATLLGFQYWLAERPEAVQNFLMAPFMGRGFMPPKDFYFGGSIRIDDLLDFLVWQHQADRLGVTLTDVDLVKELNSEAAGQEVFDEKVKLANEKLVADFLKHPQYTGMTPRDLVEGLRAEFRVVMAHGLLVGFEPGVRRFRSLLGATESPAVGTPDQFFRYYREMRTTLRVQMLPISVTAFLDKVTQQPTEQELRARYDRFRDQEPSPSLRDPGFKEPRRIAVQYVTGSPDTPFYREIARLIHPAGRAVACMGALTPMPGGAPPIAQVLPVLTPLVSDPVRLQYDDYVKNHHAWVNPDYEDRDIQEKRISKLHDFSIANKWNFVSMLGNLAGATAGVGGPFAGASTLYGTSAWDEVKGALKQNMALLLARANPQQLLPAVMLAETLSPKLTPLEKLKPQLVFEVEQKLAAETLQNNLKAIRTELTKLKGKDKASIPAYLQKVVVDYHLTLHGMRRPMQRTEMIEALNRKDDLGINGLMEAYLAHNRGLKIEDFVASLFEGSGAYDAQMLLGTQSQRKEFLYWRSEDLPARPRSFAEAKPDVIKAWKLAERASCAQGGRAPGSGDQQQEVDAQRRHALPARAETG